MMKLIITLALLLSFSLSFCQWTRVEQLPASNIFSLYHKDNIFYAGGTNVIYVSNNMGQTWDSTNAIPQLSPVTSLITQIIVYKNELYAAASRKGVFKSPDGGNTWLNISTGITPEVASDFCEYKGDLYATTDGFFANPIHKLDSDTRTRWLSFSDGLSSLSTVVNSIMGNSNVLIAGTNNNGIYDYLPANATTWEERILADTVSTAEAAFDIITAHDTFFYAGKTGRFYMSTDNALTWSRIGNRLVTGATFIVNAKEALISSRYIFDGINNTSLFYYIKKDSLQDQFVNFSVLAGHFTWKVDIIGDNLWAATDKGLYFIPLSDLPGISAVDDSSLIVLPVHFVSFISDCSNNKVVLTWKTAQEQNSHHFNIEKSIDSNTWTQIGSKPARANGNAEQTYSFTDNEPLQNSFYRIVEYDINGKITYSNILHSSCNSKSLFTIWPNPAHDRIFLNIVSGDASKALIKIFDSKGALILTERKNIFSGNNQFTLNMASFANGIYSLVAEWDNGQVKKTVQVLKH